MTTRSVVLYSPRTSPTPRVHAPLSLLALARMLPRRRWRPAIVNAAAERRAHDRVLAELNEQPLLLGISAMTGFQLLDGLDLARKVRRRYPRVPIVWGGYHPSLLPAETLSDPRVDFVVKGQGERAFAELVERIDQGETAPPSGRPLETHAPVGVGASGHEDPTPRRENRAVVLQSPPESLDRFPHLPWDLLDLSSLRKSPGGGPAVDYYTSQGCPHQCGFCAEESVHGRRRLTLSPGRAVEEIERLSGCGVRSIHLRDVLFFADQKWVEAFCELTLRRNVGVAFFGANGRVDGLLRLTPGQWRLIERAGFRELFVGIESGHLPALDRMSKGIRPEQTLELIRRARGTRIRFSLSVVLGVPHVDPFAEFQDTLQLLREAIRIEPGRISSIYVFTYLPYPGSPIYDDAIALGFQPPRSLEEWGRFDFHRTNYPWGAASTRRQSLLVHKYVLPRLLHSEPSRLRTVEDIYRLLDRRMESRWNRADFGRFWERGVYDAIDGLRRARRLLT